MDPNTKDHCSSAAEGLISEYAAGSLYNSPHKTAGSVVWMTPEPIETHCVNGTVFQMSAADLSRPSITKRLVMSMEDMTAIDTDIMLPVQLVPRILCVGAACIDIILMVNEFPAENQKVRTTESQFSGGGNAANTGGIVANCIYLLFYFTYMNSVKLLLVDWGSRYV